MRRVLDRLVVQARQAMARADSPVDRIARLNRLVFGQLGFRSATSDGTLRAMLLPFVLQRRRGSCLGLAALYLALAERLGLAMHGVLVPDHFFVRYKDGATSIAIELLERGRQKSSGWYRRTYRVPPENPRYLRSLSARETLAVFRFNLANSARERRRYGEAIADYRQVLAVLPSFAEARANLGLSYQRIGDPTRAELAYRRAAAANPNLSGVRRNLEALRRSSGE